MKQKKEYLEKKMQENYKKGLLFGYLPIGILFLLYAVFCILAPVIGLREQVLGFIYKSTYVIGILLLFHTGLFQNYTKRANKEKRHLSDTFWCLLAYAVYAIAVIVLCAHLLGRFETAMGFYVKAQPFGMTSTRNFSLYGALLAGPVVVLPAFLLKHYREKMAAYMDLTVVAIYSVMGFVKLGCHAVGCCFGIHMDPVWFGRGLVPVQLLEALSILLTMGVLIWYQTIYKRAIPGAAYPLGLLLYCPVRFVWEIFRMQDGFIKMFVFDSRLTFWQLLSIIGFVFGAVWMAVIIVKNRKAKAGEKTAA